MAELFADGRLNQIEVTLHEKIRLVILAISASIHVNAASFDCEKASTKVEKLVCIDSILSKQDERLNKLYMSVLRKIDDKESFKSAQRRWLSVVRNKCENAMCLMQVYDERIAQLNSLDMIMPSGGGAVNNSIAPTES
jgi:uncharacterized protein